MEVIKTLLVGPGELIIRPGHQRPPTRLRPEHAREREARRPRCERESLHAAAEGDDARIGWDASANLVDNTLWRDSIHWGATFRSSSGRFMVNAATTCSCRSHHTLKLLLDVSPR